MKKIAIIVAAGNGSRMNASMPKQFMLLHGKPILCYTVQAFLEAFDDLSIILVLPEDHLAKGQEIIDGYLDAYRISLCPGGPTRFHSVKNGLSLIEDEGIIWIHDGVRCLVTPHLIRHCHEETLKSGMAIPAINCKDSVRLVDEDASIAIERNKVKLVQTPQTFHSKIIIPAYQIEHKAYFTDDASVVEAYGLKIHLVDGEENNIKITTPQDMLLAAQLLEK